MKVIAKRLRLMFLVFLLTPVLSVAYLQFNAPSKAEETQPALNLANFFEVGYSVDDFEGSMDEFSQAYGVEWDVEPSATFPVRLKDGSTTILNFQFAAVEAGPPYLELVHATGEGDHPFKANPTRSPSHLGYAVTDLQASSDALVAAGMPRLATVDVPGTSAFIFAMHEGPGGIHIELIDKNFVVFPGVCDVPDSQFCPE